MKPHTKLDQATQGLAATAAVVIILTALSAIGQFSSNIYLPSLPAVAQSLSTDLPKAQATYSIFLAGFALSQLVYGPLSDRYGRRIVLLIGMGIFVGGSLLCVVAPTVNVLLAARAVQAVGAGAGVVLARAMIRDSFDGVDLTRILAVTTILFALVPGLTPLLGGIVELLFGWRMVFAVTLAAGCMVWLASAARLHETLPHNLRSQDFRGVGTSYKAVLSNRTFLGYALATAFAIGAMSAFFAGSPAVFISHLGVSPVEYGFYPPIAVSGFVIGGLIVRRSAGRVSPFTLAQRGVVLMAVGAGLSFALPVLGIVHKHGFNAGIIITVSGLGILMPTAVAAALSEFRKAAGAASGALGCLQMGFGALATICVGLLQTTLPFLAYPIIMIVAAMGALLSLQFVRLGRTGQGRTVPAQATLNPVES